MEQKRFTKNDSGFLCANCGKEVLPLKKTSRNHCPFCLCSLHLDINPGDRANECKGIMDAVTPKRGIFSYTSAASAESFTETRQPTAWTSSRMILGSLSP